MKILVIVGTQPQPFNRLLQEVKKLENKYNFIIQKATSKITYQKAIAFDYTNDLNKYIQDADIIITHGGVGSIIDSLKANKKIIVIPRLKKYGEHVNDHQLLMADYIRKNNYGIVLDNIADLEEKLNVITEITFNQFSSNNNNFNHQILNLIKEME